MSKEKSWGPEIGLAVLVLDEDAGYRRLLERELAQLGVARVVGASSPAEALEILPSFDFDAIITEWHPEFIKFLRAREEKRFSDIAVLMATEHTEPGDILAARECGIDAFVAKPVSPADLHKNLLAAVERRQRATA